MAEIEDINQKKQREKEEREERKRQQEEMARRKRERERIEKERRKARQRRKNIQPLVVLTAGAIVSIVMLLDHYPLKRMLPVLLGVLIVSCIVGELIKWMFDRFADQNEKAEDAAAAAEIEVIEKRQGIEEEEEDRVQQTGRAGQEETTEQIEW